MLSDQQKAAITELACAESRSPVTPTAFVYLAEQWVAARRSGAIGGGYVSRKSLMKYLGEPFSMQALHNLIHRWRGQESVETGAAGVRAGPRIQEIVGGSDGQARVELQSNREHEKRADKPPNSPSADRPATSGSIPDEVVYGLITRFFTLAAFKKGIPPTAVCTALMKLRVRREYLVGCIAGLLVEHDSGGLIDDPIRTLEEMVSGTSVVMPADVDVVVTLIGLQDKFRGAGDAAIMSAACQAHLGVAAVSSLLNTPVSTSPMASEAAPVQSENEEAGEQVASVLKMFATGPAHIQDPSSSGQPKPDGTSPAA
ncbi:MAG: hypothetical protein IT461_11975 [Planctomycetes bacterium]|nr:hypothetical protein [Planctomycetota bacterium]